MFGALAIINVLDSISKRVFRSITLAVLLVFCLSGCSSLVSGVTSGLADDLAASILNSNDIDTVREGVPAYLIMVDSFLRGSPESEDLLLAASNLNGAFSALIEDPLRIKILANKAMEYAEQAACVSGSPLCDARAMSFTAFEAAVASLKVKDVPLTYALGVAWVGRLQANSDDWAVIAELGRAKALMARVIELDETFEKGGPHLYMGGMETLLPASLGGKPAKGRMHFEKAIALNDQYLMTRVIFAGQYARLVFDQELHDQLLNEVISANPEAEGLTLTNLVAQERARELLKTSAEYF